MKEKIYIIDFDHTLFNAREYRQTLGKFINGSNEITSEEIWEFLRENPTGLDDFMGKENSRYIFQEVKEYLSSLRGRKILLTHGDVNFQQKKVEASGILDFFEYVHYIEVGESKIEFLKEILQKSGDREIYFINDNYNKRHKILENDEVRIRFPDIKVFDIDNYGDGKGIPIQKLFVKLFRKEKENN